MSTSPAAGVIALGASRWLAVWVICASLAAVLLLLFYLPLAVALAAGCLVMIEAWRNLRLHTLRRHPEALVALKFGGGEFACQLRRGTWHDCVILAGGMVTRWIIVARLRVAGETPHNRVLVLCRDSLNAGDFRRLCVHLRWDWRDPAQHPDIKV